MSRWSHAGSLFRCLAPVLCALALAGCSAYSSGGGGGNGGGGTNSPPAPSGLTATAANGQVNLSWNASAGASAYYVKRSTMSGGPYSQIAALAATSYADNAVTNGTKYYYVVSAYNSSGQSANSSEVSATPTAPPPPAAPTGLQASPGNGQVSLTWNAVSGATSYHVKRSTSSGSETQISAPTTTSFTDTGLTNGTKYFYVVSAVSSAGESANSSEVNAAPSAPVTPPPAPAGLQATPGNAQVSLAWNASTSATSYHVKLK